MGFECQGDSVSTLLLIPSLLKLKLKFSLICLSGVKTSLTLKRPLCIPLHIFDTSNRLENDIVQSIYLFNNLFE